MAHLKPVGAPANVELQATKSFKWRQFWMDVRKIDFEGAELFIDAGGDWRGFRSAACAKEPETAAWLERVADDRCVLFDIGACVGSYSLIASALGATVHAFEPIATNFDQLQRNAWLNNVTRVTAWPIACAAATGPLFATLSSPAPGAGSHGVGQPMGPASNKSSLQQTLVGFALDAFTREFGLPLPTDIKIDVDGYEVEVLEGARNLLKTVRTVMVEVSPGSAPSAAAILNAAGLEQTGSWARSGRQSNHLYERVSRK